MPIASDSKARVSLPKMAERLREVARRPPSWILFVFFLAFYSFLGMRLSYKYALPMDYVFNADSPRVVADLTIFDAGHGRVQVHPLFVILLQPIILAVGGLVGSNTLAIILVEAAFGSAQVVMLRKLLERLIPASPLSLVLSLIYGFSFSAMVFSAIAETFVFSGFGLIALWCIAVHLRRQTASPTASELVCLACIGVFAAGITVTNALWVLIAYLYVVLDGGGSKAKSFGLLVSVSLCVGFGLVLLQWLVWDCPPFWDGPAYAEKFGAASNELAYCNFTFDPSKIEAWLRGSLLYSLVAPTIRFVVTSKPLIVFGPDNLLNLLANSSFYVVTCVLAIRGKIIGFARNRRVNAEATALGLVLLGNLLLHFFYAPYQSFLFSQNYLFALVVVCALVWSSGETLGRAASIAISVFLVCFLVVQIISNLQGFETMVDATAQLFTLNPAKIRALFISLAVAIFASIGIHIWHTSVRRRSLIDVARLSIRAYGLLLMLSMTFLFAVHWD